MKKEAPAQKSISNPKVATRLVQLLQRFSEWRGGIGVIIFILMLALITRTVNLSSFPYFPSQWPWNGVNGLYWDEWDTSLMPSYNFVYFPFLQIALMGFSINLLGYSTFSVRLVSALFSSVTSVLVYLSALELYHRKLPAFLSSLFFIFMTPALIYGRMVFVENGATTFFVATLLFSLKYFNTSQNRWLTCSAVSAGLSILCKQTGIAAAIYLSLAILAYKPAATRQLLKVLVIIGCLGAIYLAQILILNPGYLLGIVKPFFFPGIRSVDWFNVFLTTPMPTGTSLMWHHFPEMFSYFWFIRLDFWYILSFFLIVYLSATEKETVRAVLLAITSYVLFLVIVGHALPYYMTLIQPFMAIPVGYGLLKLKRMHGTFALSFSLLLCFPAISYIDYYVSYYLVSGATTATSTLLNFLLVSPIAVSILASLIRTRRKQHQSGIIHALFLIYYAGWLAVSSYLVSVFPLDSFWIVLQFVVVVPLVIAGILRFAFQQMNASHAVTINICLVVFYVGCLIVGSYVLPVFYPGYFAQTTVPI